MENPFEYLAQKGIEKPKWFVDKENAERRLEVCKECPKLIKLSNQCKVCLCFMPIKTRLNLTSCPLGKWEEIDSEYKETIQPPSKSEIIEQQGANAIE